ncbi:MAG: DUF3047 domain-containing protein [Elusimicrobia bacterium]|nr:DUF3047 domain-containing protein [Elusimicrobiota bacterium]
MALVALALLARLAGAAEPVWVEDFSAPPAASGLPEGWKPLTFRKVPRRTEYRVEREAGNAFLAARSSASASGLHRPAPVELARAPVLAWRWRVARVVAGADARRRSGDDYAARLYVAFAYDPQRASLWQRARYGTVKALYGEYPPHAAINYVWDNRLASGTELDNAYTSRVKMVVLRSGNGEAGRWLSERRDVREDYRRLFGAEPPRVSFIAVMTDTDDTGESAEAAYDDLAFLPPL